MNLGGRFVLSAAGADIAFPGGVLERTSLPTGFGFSISTAAGAVAINGRDSRPGADFHWALIRRLILCRSGVGFCSSTTTVEKKPELINFERKSTTCCESLMNRRRARSQRRFMVT